MTLYHGVRLCIIVCNCVLYYCVLHPNVKQKLIKNVKLKYFFPLFAP